MKTQIPFLLITTLATTASLAGDPNLTPIGDPASGFYVGQTSFPQGDSIEITSVERSPNRLVVRGHYDLVSADSASLSLFITTPEAISVPTDRSQLKTIHQGAGDFELIDPNLAPGMPHVTMYSLPAGRPFAGVYFGTKAEAAEESKIDLGYAHDAKSPTPGTGAQPGNGRSTSPVVTTGPNQALLEYLGNPVPPPANLDARYTAQGISGAVLLAARNANITPQNVAVDDSEFPCLVAVTCAGSDYVKLKNQLRKLDGYEYNGSIGNDSNSDGSDTCNAFSMVPYRAYPSGTSQQIYHRLGLRQQVFYDKINQR